MKKQLKIGLIIVLQAGLLANNPTYSQEPLVKIENGLISGTKSGGVNIFKAIPYAAPPVGNLRWKAPQPAANWTGVKECRSFSASPVQTKPVPFRMWTQEFIAPAEPLSEDCLYLNIWSPTNHQGGKLPVFVWIYGGAFVSGSSACPIYDGEEYAKSGIIFVSFNYRLGVFGFLALEELSKESGYKSSGNYALLDMIAALKWVKRNIGAFGGDPENITIAGQSAGSMSVTGLLVSPLATGLFQRAIAQSGGILSVRKMTTLSEAEQNGKELERKLHVSNLSELRELTSGEIMNAVPGGGYGQYGPILDGYVLTVDPGKLTLKDINSVPVIAGWVTGDADLGGGQVQNEIAFKKMAKEKYGEMDSAFLKIFPAEPENKLKASQARLSMLSFACLPAHRLAILNSKNSYLYQFSHIPPDKPGFPNYGAFHSSEISYVLKTLNKWDRPWKDADFELESKLSQYWINFARTGNPNGSGLPEWKPYTKETGCIIHLSDKIFLYPEFLKREIDFLDRYGM